MHTRPSAPTRVPSPMTPPAATLPDVCEPAPAHCEAKLAEASPLCDVESFPSLPPGLSHLQAATSPLRFSGFCQSSKWPQTGSWRRRLFIGQALVRPRPLSPLGLRPLWAPLRMRGGGGPGLRAGLPCVAVAAPAGLPLLLWSCAAGVGCAREGRGPAGRECARARGAAVLAVPLARGGRPR